MGVVKVRPEILYSGGMRTAAALWFAAAFLVGAGLFLGTRPRPVLNAFVIELRGGGLFEHCRKAGACSKPAAPHPLPAPRQLPTDPDRA